MLAFMTFPNIWQSKGVCVSVLGVRGLCLCIVTANKAKVNSGVCQSSALLPVWCAGACMKDSAAAATVATAATASMSGCCHLQAFSGVWLGGC